MFDKNDIAVVNSPQLTEYDPTGANGANYLAEKKEKMEFVRSLQLTEINPFEGLDFPEIKPQRIPLTHAERIERMKAQIEAEAEEAQKGSN